MSTRTSTIMDQPIVQQPRRIMHLGHHSHISALAIAAALAAGMPPRDEMLGKTVVGPEPKSPERLTAAQSRRERRNAKRLRHAVAAKGGSV